MYRTVFRFSRTRAYLGLTVAAFEPVASDAETQFAKIVAALDLIATHHPRTIDRLRDDTDGILVFGTKSYTGQWMEDARLVFLAEEPVLDPSTPPLTIALILVHEAAHAWLTGRGFEYREDRRVRMEAISVRSEIAFARRVPDSEALLASLERALLRDPSYWTDANFRARERETLVASGVPQWIIDLLDHRGERSR
jgi:hypothetical protein